MARPSPEHIQLVEGRPPPAYSEEDDGDVSSDEGNQDEEALLGSENRTRGRERYLQNVSSNVTKLWPQIKDIVLESAPTLLLTTISLLFTGELLDQVSKWKAMRQVDQLIMIIPVILNLKGNLEMNLSARLGTAANVGDLDDPPTRKSLVLGNLTLLQVQATVVSFIAACVSLVLGLIIPRTPEPSTSPTAGTSMLWARRPRPQLPTDRERSSGLPTFVMVASTSMTAACLSSIILGSFMCFLIIICRRFGRDPDNIAPPIAACLGDLVTLTLLGLVSTGLIDYLRTPIPLILGIIVVLVAVACLVYTMRNPDVRDLVKQGWSPLFGAMIISSGTGIVLDLFVTRYEGFALLAVVISGLPGSVGSIFVSRLSTALHREKASRGFQTSKAPNQPSSRVVMITLLLITIPVEIIFLSVLRGIGWLKPPFLFVAFSVGFFCIAVTVSLFIAQLLTNFLWSRELDPDMYALPIHSALMDLIGQLLLVVCFEIVSLLGVHLETTKSVDSRAIFM